jgi:hypothetical protein
MKEYWVDADPTVRDWKLAQAKKEVVQIRESIGASDEALAFNGYVAEERDLPQERAERRPRGRAFAEKR